MAITLNSIVPWGRSFAEYVSMFSLTETDLKSKILGCGDGPASFNSEMKKRGYKVVSIDPVYQFSAEQIRSRINAAYDEIMAQLLKNRDDYIWDTISSPEELGRIRMSAMREFLTDFEQGKQEGRYQTEELPLLPFGDKEFDLALSSHFLFLFTAHVSLDFHRQAIAEMCRVANEVRIFPLQTLGRTTSPYVAPIIAEFTAAGYAVTIEPVAYEFQRGSNQMLKISYLRGLLFC
jgi:SAM-dependent methyltransferase